MQIMNLLGREPIHPVIFYSGKGSGYILWVLLPLSFFGVIHIGRNPIRELILFSYLTLAAGLCLSIISLVNLGSSTRLGLPTDRTAFKTAGLYRFSRNPMYLGFNLVTLSSAAYHGGLLLLVLAIYSICVYHFIILAEERYMEGAFGQAYREYRTKVRRYL